MKQFGSFLMVLLLIGASAIAQHPRTPLFEEFTSSTCPPCAAVKPYVEQFAHQNPDVVVVTYHMDWPAPAAIRTTYTTTTTIWPGAVTTTSQEFLMGI